MLSRNITQSPKSSVAISAGRKLLLNTAFILGTSYSLTAKSNPLLGQSGTAGRSSASSADLNPAHAAMLRTSELDLSTSLYQNSDLKLRYPGFETIEKRSATFFDLLSINAAGIFKVSPRLGLGLADFEPPLAANLKVTEMPVIILGQTNYVDMNIHVQLNGGFTGLLGYRFTSKFSLGLKAHFSSRDISASAVPSEGGGEVFSYQQHDTTGALGIGSLLEISRQFTLGVSSNVVGYHAQETKISSPLLPSTNNGGDSASGGFTTTTPLDNIRLGLGWTPTSSLLVDLDLDYKRSTAETAYSLAELKEKQLDVYDTLSLSLGGEYAGLENGEYLAGFHYEPSGIGPGSRGEGGKTGYGTFQSLPVYAGQGDLLPYYSVSGGIRMRFLPAKNQKSDDADTSKGKWPKASKSGATQLYKVTMETGFVYQSASLGIDESGDQPAAYSQTKVSIPLKVSYLF